MIELKENYYQCSHYLMKIAERDLRTLKLDNNEIMGLNTGLRYHNEIFEKIFRAVELIKTSINYIIRNGKEPPEELTSEIIEITRSLHGYKIKMDPLAVSLSQVYDKYILPERR